jgi:hypothetical protein
VKPNECFKRQGVQEASAMTTRKNILAAMVGLAMLAMPVRALAGDHHHRDWDDNPRPQAWHDQGRHNGWFKNHGDRDDYRPGWNGRNYYQPPVWHHEPDGDEHRYYQPAWHHEDEEDENYNGGGGYYGGGYSGNYGTPYYGKSLGQLMVDRQNEYRTYISLLNRHDSRAANRYRQKVLNPTDQRIAALNRGYVPPSPGFLGGPVNWGNGNYNAYPYGSGYNNGYYGNNGNNPMGGLGALVGPLLGVTP